MNRLSEAIAGTCREYPLDEKWLVAPSLRVGNQWLDTIARSGLRLVNVRVKTVRAMAVELAAGEMARRGVGLVSALAGQVVVESAWRRVRRESGGYLSRLRLSESLTRSIHRSLVELRLAGFSPGEMDARALEVAEKGRELEDIHAAYVDELRARKLIDYADACRLAAERLRGGGPALPDDLVVLFPGDGLADLSRLERDVLKALPDGKLVRLPTDGPDEPDEAPVDDDRQGVNPQGAVLRGLRSSVARRGREAFRVFRAVGEANEVREALRRVLADGVRLDDVEFLHTDYDTYVPLVYETFARLGLSDGDVPGGLSVTFAEGIPSRYSRPGRALSAWVAWIGDGFPQSTFVRMIRDGLLECPAGEGGGGDFSELASALRRVRIGFGRDRYLPCIDAEIRMLERRRGRAEVAKDEPGGDSRERAAHRIAALGRLRGMIEGLLDPKVTPDPNVTPERDAQGADVLRAAVRFLRDHARAAGRLDNFARRRLVEEIEMVLSVAGEGRTHGNEWEWLAALPGEREARVEGSGPRPGCLHVASALSGGYSGRAHTFIVGLDEGRFPGAGLQDPLLLDSERARLSADLPTASGRLGERTVDLARMLARLPGNVTLSFSCRDLAEDREMFASPVVISAYRELSGERGGDQTGLARWLGVPASFAPGAPEGALDESEWWLWRLCGAEDVAGPAALVKKRFPHLARGIRACEGRRAIEFTVYDGRAPDAGSALDPTSAEGPVMSSTSLEMLGRCPRAYFFRYALRIEAPEELDTDADTWLDPGAFGTLLHEVFKRFMAELVEKGEKPVYSRHAARLYEILSEVVKAYRDDLPPPNESAYRRQCDELRYAARIFLTEEERHCRASDPAYLEEWVADVFVDLPGGRRIKAQGRIDRVDRLPGQGEAFAVWDYKTGSPYRYRGPDPFRQGRNVQHALYLEIARAMLKRKVSPEATPARFGYFFPSVRGRGERIEYAREDLSEGMKVLALLCDVVRAGSFIATDDAGDCRYCDYTAVCGHDDEAANMSRAKREAGGNEALAAFRELRREEEEPQAESKRKAGKKARKKTRKKTGKKAKKAKKATRNARKPQQEEG